MTIYPQEALVVLNQDLKAYDLKRGDVGKITQINKEDNSYLVTFKSFEGESLAWIKLRQDQIRPI